MKRFRIVWVLLALSSLPGRVIWAQPLEAKPSIAQLLDPGEDWRWRTYPFDETYEPVRVRQFFEDSKANVWAATNRGLMRFSGYRWEWESLPSSAEDQQDVLAVFERVPGELFAQAGHRLLRRREERWEAVELSLPAGDRIVRAAPAAGDKVFVLTAGGDYLYDGTRLVLLADGLPSWRGMVVQLFPGQQQDLWLGGSPSLRRWRGEHWEQVFSTESPIAIESMAFGHDFGFMAIRGPLAMRGLWKWGPNGWTHIAGSERDVVVSIAIADNGEVVTASESGQSSVYSGGNWKTIREGLSMVLLRRPNAIGFQRNGTLWVATNAGISAYRTRLRTWQKTQYPAPDFRNTIHHILARRNGELWTAGIEGVTIWRPGQEPELVRRVAGLEIRNVTGLAEDEAGRVWLSSGSEFGGAVRWDGQRWERVRAREGLTDEPINRILAVQGPAGGRSELWFLVTLPAYHGRDEKAGAYRLVDGRFEHWTTQQGLPDNAVYSVAIDRDGYRWFGTLTGLSRWKEGEPVRRWGPAEGLVRARIQELRTDAAGRVWFVHRSMGGVGVLDPADGWQRAKYFGVKHGLPSEEAWGLGQDSAGRIWASTRNGVAVWSGGPWVRLHSGIGNEIQNAWSLQEWNGKMVVGTVGQGLHFLDLQWTADRLPRVNFRLPITIDGQVIQEWRPRTRLEDQRAQEVLTRSRVDGGRWSEWSTLRRHAFAATDYGEHVLEVQSAGFWGDVNPETARITVEVPTPFYRRPLFLFLGGVVLCALAGLIVAYTRRRAEYTRQLMRAKREAEEAAKAKSNFLAMMSHEIRTPMNGVLGMSSLLMESPLADDQRQFVDTIQESAESLLRILDDALDYSKIEAGVLEIREEPFSVEELADSVAVLMTPRAIEKGIDLGVAMDGDVPAAILGDPARIRQILVNLTSNAVKFTDQGWVEIQISCRLTEPDRCLVRFAVTDTGIGIAAHQLDLLFREFSQVDSSPTRRHGGTGLGLVISRRLTERMKGHMGVESEPGRGSTFWCEIPFPVSLPAHSGQPIPTLIVGAGDRPGVSGLGRYVKGFEGLRTQTEPAGRIVVDGWLPLADWRAIQAWREDHPEWANAQWIALLPAPLELGPEWQRLPRPLSRRRLNMERTSPSAASGDQAALAGVHVLVAEDNRTNQQVVRRLLERMGCRVTIVEDGAAVLEAANEDVDIILMDCQMPVMDGLEATRRLRAGHGPNAHTPIIALTANGSETDRLNCLAAGMTDFLPKPIDTKALRGALERCRTKPAVS